MNTMSSPVPANSTFLQHVMALCVRRPLVMLAVYVAAVSAFFLVFPGVDLWVSGLFYDAQAGFWAQHVPFLSKVRHLGPHLVTWIAAGSILVLVLKLALPGQPPLLPLRIPVFLTTTLILGPGVLVNAILKDNWGRPRPRSVEEFGGDLPHQTVWVPTDYCASNCSFTSGEASSGIWLAALAFVVPAAWRLGILAFVLPLCVILSVNRVAFGGHFLSDTMISWGLTMMVIVAVYKLLYTARFHPSDQAVDRVFSTWGRALHCVISRVWHGLRLRLGRFAGMFSEKG